MKTIAILLHERDDSFDKCHYLLKPMLRNWETRGFRVVMLHGVRHFIPADLLIPHIDLTVTPPDYMALFERYPRVVNQRVLNIAKTSFSTNLLQETDAYDGPVIVKTNNNYGGRPEKKLRVSKPSPLASRLLRPFIKLGHRLTRDTPWQYIESLPADQYPVFDSLHQVPNGVFRNSRLVVERFLAERDGDDYCLRYYSFLGERETSLLLRSRAKVAKGANIHKMEECPVPEELRETRRQLGFDYGKFDYVLREGKVVLFDVNRTPSSTVLQRFNRYDSVSNHLAGGIDALLGTSM